jgi:hypothetical protein
MSWLRVSGVECSRRRTPQKQNTWHANSDRRAAWSLKHSRSMQCGALKSCPNLTHFNCAAMLAHPAGRPSCTAALRQPASEMGSLQAPVLQLAGIGMQYVQGLRLLTQPAAVLCTPVCLPASELVYLSRSCSTRCCLLMCDVFQLQAVCPATNRQHLTYWRMTPAAAVGEAAAVAAAAAAATMAAPTNR